MSLDNQRTLRIKEVCISELDRWYYICNVWFGAVRNQMSKPLQEELADQFLGFHHLFAFTLVSLYCCMPTRRNAQNMQLTRAWRSFAALHEDVTPNEHFFVLSRACNGSRPDIVLEG